MDQTIIEFLNNLIRQAMLQQQQQQTLPNDPLAFIPMNDIITRSMQMNAPSRPVFGFGNSFDNNSAPIARPTQPNLAGTAPTPYLPGTYGGVTTGIQPTDPNAPLVPNRDLSREYLSGVGGIFPHTLVDYYHQGQPVRSFAQNTNTLYPSRDLSTRGIPARTIV